MDTPEQTVERVIDRLQRIQELTGRDEPALLLDELRELVEEAEAWAKLEGDARARAAVGYLDEALAEIEEVRLEALTTR